MKWGLRPRYSATESAGRPCTPVAAKTPSTSPSDSPASASAAIAASPRISMDVRPGASPVPAVAMPAMAARPRNVPVMMSALVRDVEDDRRLAVDRRDAGLHPCPDRDRVDALDTRHQARAFLEVDERDVVAAL